MNRPATPDQLAKTARAALEGDAKAVRTLLVAVGPSLLRVARKVLGAQHPDLEDVVQESAHALIDALPDHRGECTVLHFACRIAVLTAMNTRRRAATRKRMSVRDESRDIDTFSHHALGPDHELSAQASASLVRYLLEALPIEQAEVLAMHCMLGYTMPEIAASAGLSVETVRSRFRLAKGALRALVSHQPALLGQIEDSL